MILILEQKIVLQNGTAHLGQLTQESVKCVIISFLIISVSVINNN